jgi:hypothetical protein
MRVNLIQVIGQGRAFDIASAATSALSETRAELHHLSTCGQPDPLFASDGGSGYFQ